jgi:galactose mutarotase-like enzyme
MYDLPTAHFQERTLVRIGNDRADGSLLLLAPEAGGRLVRWRHQGEEILYWPNPADWSNPAKIRGGNPLLFPFIGRGTRALARRQWPHPRAAAAWLRARPAV